MPGPKAKGQSTARRIRGGRSAPQKMRRRAELPKHGQSAKTDRCRYHQDDTAHPLLQGASSALLVDGLAPTSNPFPAAGGT